MKQPGKTLIILTPGFPENEADTTCLPAQQAFISALNKDFRELNIVILSFQYPFISTSYPWHGNLVIPLNGRNKGKIYRLRVWLRAWQTLKKLIKEYHVIGMLHFWCTECALVGSCFARRYGIKQYTWLLGQDARKKNKFIHWIKPDAENLLAMSPFLAAEFYRNHHLKPAHIIPNGIDISRFACPVKSRDMDILGVGSLIPLKQYAIFIRVIKKLSASIPDIRGIIFGKGPEGDPLRKMILDEDLQNHLSMPGERAHGEILQWMSRSKILLHPSSYEGFSTVCLEALYAGARVISFCDPQIGHVHHWHIVKNEKEMVEVALKILQDQDTDHGRVLVYPMDKSAKQVMKLFQYDGP